MASAAMSYQLAVGQGMYEHTHLGVMYGEYLELPTYFVTTLPELYGTMCVNR